MLDQRRRAVAAPLLALLLLAPAARATAAAQEAPLGVGTEGPLRALFLDVTGADARTSRNREVAFRWEMANDWSAPTTLVRGNDLAFLQLDGQSDAFSLAVRLPWSVRSRRLSTSIEARATLWSGGWTDPAVEKWHKVIGFTNFQRGKYPSNDLRLVLRDGSGTTAFDVRRARWSLGRVAVRNQLQLASGGSSLRAPASAPRERWAVALRADARLPLGSLSGLAGSGGTDVGAGLLATAEVTRWCVAHANVFTSVWSRIDGGLALQPRRFHHGAELSVALLPGRWAVLLEDRVLSPVFSGDWKVKGVNGYRDVAASATFAATRWQNQISVGVRRGMFTAWFSEDITPGRTAGSRLWFFNSNSPDIAIGVELGRSL